MCKVREGREDKEYKMKENGYIGERREGDKWRKKGEKRG